VQGQNKKRKKKLRKREAKGMRKEAKGYSRGLGEVELRGVLGHSNCALRAREDVVPINASQHFVHLFW
jgi:hypothetical protein